MEGILLPGTIEVVEDAQPLPGVQLFALGAKSRKVGGQVCPHSGEIGAGLLHIFLGYGEGQVLLLHNPVGSRGLVQEHLVVLLAVLVPEIPPQGHENGILKVGFVQPPVVDGQLSGCARIQRVEQLRIGEEHALLVLPAGHPVIDVRKLESLGVEIAAQKNAVLPNATDGDHILHPAWDGVALFFQLSLVVQCFQHPLPPFRSS